MVISASPAFTASPSWWCRRTRRPATGGVMRTSFSGSASMVAGADRRVCSGCRAISATCRRSRSGEPSGTTMRLPSRRTGAGCGAVVAGVAAAAWVSAGPLQAAMATLISSPPTGHAAASKGWRWCRPWGRPWGWP
nr:hypothetical protein [Delftia lacustris]